MDLFGYHKDQVIDVFRGLARVHRFVSEMHQSRQHETDLSGTQFHDPFLLFLSEHICHLTFFLYRIRRKQGLQMCDFTFLGRGSLL